MAPAPLSYPRLIMALDTTAVPLSIAQMALKTAAVHILVFFSQEFKITNCPLYIHITQKYSNRNRGTDK